MATKCIIKHFNLFENKQNLGCYNEGTLFKVNGQHLKIFLEPNKEPNELDVIEFFAIN